MLRETGNRSRAVSYFTRGRDTFELGNRILAVPISALWA